ncbi:MULTISPECIES: ferrochelatase [Sphingomonas]|uniref:ferrochelatase n=1 Tax=Sphingomonas TaxID=13687 RepID=UPI00241392DE|nr:ferrochelatase [Sphingomonas echinoides]
MQAVLPAGHPPVKPRRIGVLLTNLGTPDGSDVRSVKRYLGEFLSDRRVVEISPLVWQPILRGIILNTRPKKSAHAYSQVWTADGSPLAAITKAQSTALQGAFGPDVMVDWAMRYGKPAIGERLQAMKDAGCDRILIAPLYPQYCAATTATANDKAFAELAKMRWQPALRTLPPYHDDPAYIDALAESIEAGVAALDFEPDALIASFHGMPKRTLELGDPYHCHCQKTGRLLGERLGKPLIVSFQSRFGPAKWLEPATDMTLEELPATGVKKVAIFAPGFSADCLETLEELAIRGRESFEEKGGTHFAYIPCLNASDIGIKMLRTLLARELEGWANPA